MKKLILIILIISIRFTISTAQTKKFFSTNFKTTQLKSEFLLYLSKNYSANALAILNYRSPDYYTQWAKGNSHREMLNNYGTVVHETCHSANFDIGGFQSKGFYINSKIEIKVPTSRVFKSSELDKFIPDNVKNKIFRYKTYVKGEEGEVEISSISDGIFGLMDEFDAYYQGTRAEVELYGYYKTFSSYTAPYDWASYILNCYSTIYAYYEFRLFIAWYLKYAKKEYPEIFKSLIENKNLKVVYTLIDKAYKQTIDQYFINREKIVSEINKAGTKKASITDKYFQISNKKGSIVGYGIPDGDIAYLKSLYTDLDYQMLKLITIENINETNYKTYLD
jgi:hypothetical protein